MPAALQSCCKRWRPAYENLQRTKPRDARAVGGAACSAMGIWAPRCCGETDSLLAAAIRIEEILFAPAMNLGLA